MHASAGAQALACRLPVGPRAGAVRSQRALPRRVSAYRGSRLACTAAATSQSTTSDAKSSKAFAALAAEFGAVPEGQDRYKLLLKYAASLPPLPSAQRTLDNRVMGCTSQTWASVSVDQSTGAAAINGELALSLSFDWHLVFTTRASCSEFPRSGCVPALQFNVMSR